MTMTMNASVSAFRTVIIRDGSSIQGGRPDALRLRRGVASSAAMISLPIVVLASPVVVVVVRCMA